jgi:hypothetical protein
VTGFVYWFALKWFFLHQRALLLQFRVLKGSESLSLRLLHQLLAWCHFLVIVTIIILLIITHGYEFDGRLSQVWLLSCGLFDEDTVWVSLHVVTTVGSVPSVLQIVLLLVVYKLDLLLARCTLALVLCLVAWLIVYLGRANPVNISNLFPHLVVIKVTCPKNLFVFIEKLLIPTHNGCRIFKSNQFLRVRV